MGCVRYYVNVCRVHPVPCHIIRRVCGMCTLLCHCVWGASCPLSRYQTCMWDVYVIMSLCVWGASCPLSHYETCMWDVYVIMSLCVCGGVHRVPCHIMRRVCGMCTLLCHCVCVGVCIVSLVTLSDVYVGCVRYYVTVCVWGCASCPLSHYQTCMWDVYVIMSLCVGCIVSLVTLSDVYVGCVRYYVNVCRVHRVPCHIMRRVCGMCTLLCQCV